MAVLDRQSVIDSFRENYKILSRNYPDDDKLYEYIYSQTDPKKVYNNPSYEYEPPEDIYAQRQAEQEKTKLEEHTKKSFGKEIITPSPRTWLESSAAGYFGDLFDSDYLRYAATQGTADLSRMILTGTSGYQLKNEQGQVIQPEEYAENLNMFQEVGAWILGQANPADLAIWGLSGGIGKIFATSGTQLVKGKVVQTALSEGGQSWFQKKWAKGVTGTFVKNQRLKNTPYSKYIADWAENAPATMASIGAFSAAAGTVGSANNQRKTNDDGTSAWNEENQRFEGTVNTNKVITDGMYEGIKGTILGGVVAGVHPALSGPMANVAKSMKKSNNNFVKKLGELQERWPKTSVGIPSVPIEGAIFGNLPYVIEGMPKKENGDADLKQVWHDFAHGSVTVAGLKGTLGAFGAAAKRLNIHSTKNVLGPEGNIAYETGKSTRKTLSEILPPDKVNKFLKELTVEEKIQIENKLGKNSTEIEIENFVQELSIKARELLVKMEEPNFNINKLSDAEALNWKNIYNSLTVVKEVLKERLAPEQSKQFEANVKRQYNKEIKGTEETPWKDLPVKEKNQIIKIEKRALKKIIEQAEKQSTTFNENVINPISASKQTIEKNKTEILKTFKSLDTAKQLEIKDEVGNIGKLSDKKVLELKEKIEVLKSRETPEQTIEVLKKELNALARKERMSLKEWKAEIAEQIIEGDPKASIKNLKSLITATKKSGVQASKIEDKIAEVDLGKVDISSKTGKGIERKTKNGKTNKDLLEEVNLSDKNKKMAVIGIRQFLMPRDLHTPGNVRKLLKFFNYLEKLGLNINEANTTIFGTFVKASKSKGGLETNKPNVMKPYQDIVAAFYGGKLGGAKQTGFSDFYMESKGVATTLRVPTSSGKMATVDAPEQVKMLDKIETYNETISNTNPREAKSALELFYWFGRRSTDILQIKVEDLNIKDGTITLMAAKKIGGVRIPTTYGIKEVLPGLFNRLVKLADGKNGKDLLISNKNGQKINLKPIIKKITKGLKINLLEGQKEFTSKSFRNTLETDASSINMELFATHLTGRGKTVQESYVGRDWVVEFNKFKDFRLGKKTKQQQMTQDPSKPVGPEATRSEVSRFKEWSKNKFPELKTEFNKRKLKGEEGETLSENVLETVAGTLVKVRQGAPIEAAVHGSIHPIIKTLRAISKTNKGKKLGKEAAGLMREIERRITKTKEFKNWYKDYRTDKFDKNGKLIRKRMTAKEAREQAIEEATAVKMGEIVSGRIVDRTFFKKMTDWAKRVYTNIKTYFKSVDKLSDNELFDLFGQKIYDRNIKEIPLMSFTNETKGKMQFMTISKEAPVEDLRKVLKKHLKKYTENTNMSIDELVTELVGQSVSAETPFINFKLNMSTQGELIRLFDTLASPNFVIKGKNKEPLKRIKTLNEIDKYKADTAITEKQEANWFRQEGTTKNEASLETLIEWKNTVFERKDTKLSESKIDIDFNLITNKELKDVNPRLTNSTINKMRLVGQQLTVGFNRILKGLNFKSASRWVTTHLSAEQRHIGKLNGFIARAEGKSKVVFGPERKNIRKSWKNVEEVFGLLEAAENGNFKGLNDPTVSPAEKAQALKFAKKAFIIKTVKNKKTGKLEYFNEGINFNSSTKKGTVEGELMYYFKENVMRAYEREFMELLELRFPNAGAREKFIKDNNIQFLNQTKEAFYIPQRFNETFAEYYGPEVLATSEGIKAAAKKEAIKMAKLEHGKNYDKATETKQTEMIKKHIEMATERVQVDLMTSANHGAGKITLKNLITRNKYKLPQRIVGKDKSSIKVFDTNFESVVMPYSTGMSKLLANMEYAPWAVGLKAYTRTGDVQTMLKEASETLGIKGKYGAKVKRLIQDGIMERTGMSNERDGMGMITGVTREYTATLMRLQLGGVIPLTGVWNLMEQAKQVVLAYRLRDVTSSFVKSFNLAERLATEDAGAVSSIGLLGHRPGQRPLLGKTIEGKFGVSKKLNRATEWLFKKGGMPFTESFGRTWARLASGMEMQRIVNNLKNLPETNSKHKYAKKRLKSFYEIPELQINLLKKYGLEPNLTKLNSGDANMVKRAVRNAFNKAELVGNIKTAGTTVESLSAGWTNYKVIKPLLMYKKIAMSTSMNNMELLKYNTKHGHFLRTGLFLGGAYLKGTARIAIMSALFKQTSANVENTDWWTSFWATMYNGEFLGIISELLSPYKDSHLNLNQSIIQEAAMTQNYKRTLSLLAVLAQSGDKNTLNTGVVEKFFGKQKMSVEDAGVEWLRSTVSSYNQYYKIMNQSLNAYNADYKKIQVWNRNYNKKHSFQGREDFEATDATMYMRKLRTVFNSGTEAQFHKELTLAYFGLISKALENGKTETKAMKEAASEIQKKLKNLNPIGYSIDPNNDYKITPFEGFWLSLDEKSKNTTAKTYMKYKKRITKYEKSWHYFLRSNNMKDYMKHFDFKMDKKLLKSYLIKMNLKGSSIK